MSTACNSRLEVRGLQKSYGSRMVVKDVSLSVECGEVVGLLGPNGAGKTTSFYMIVGLVRVDAGQILLDGQSIESLPMHRRARLGLGYLPQEASIFRKLSVEDNIRAVLELQVDPAGKALSQAEIERRLEALLAVADADNSLIITGNGDVIQPEDDLIAIGSGGPFAQAAARALLDNTELSARDIVDKALTIAGDICVFTNQHHTIDVLGDSSRT